MHYTGLKLTDPETGQELFRCAELAATWTSMTDSQGQTRPAIVLTATQAESADERLATALRSACAAGWSARVAGRKSKSASPPTSGRCTTATETQVLQVVEGGVGLMPNGIQAQLAFRLPGWQFLAAATDADRTQPPGLAACQRL